MFAGSPVHFAWGVAFSLLLLTGCASDLKARRIPNWLVAVLLVSGLVYSMSLHSVGAGLTRSLAGIALGFGLWIGFHLLGVLGAGDVKFFSAAGAWLGAGAAFRAALLAAIVGGLLAIGYLLAQRRMGAAVRGLWLAAATRSPQLARSVSPGTRGAHRELPYGVALAAGALAAAWIPGLLA